jgi:hypothetical protein
MIKRAHRSQVNPLLPSLEAASARIWFSTVHHHARLTLHLFSAIKQMSMHLFALPLVRLVVLERESARPLVRTCLPADPAIAAGKQNAPESNGGEEGGAQRSEAEGQNARLGPHSIAIEGIYGVEDRGYGESGESVGSFGIGSRSRNACIGS